MNPNRRTVVKGIAALPVALALPTRKDPYLVRGDDWIAVQYLCHPSPDLLVHSRGGESFSFFALRQFAEYRSARVYVEGIAGGSAVLLIALEDASIHPGGFVHFISHWTTTSGSPAGLERTADLLDELDQRFAVLVAQRSRVDVAQVRAWMAEDRWLSAEEALAAGLVNSIRERPQWEA